MPTRKEWVVDETGFHAKSVFETAPADKTAVYVDDTPNPSGNAKNEDKYEVKLLDGIWLKGEEGFQFNKKCKVRVTGKLLKETSRTRITIKTFVTFKDEKKNEDVKEDLGQTIDTDLEKVNKDSMEVAVEAEVMLFYGDKYNKALRDNPELTCCYRFTAESNVADKILESELLEMPVKEQPVDLQQGMYDDLAVKTYPSRKASEKGYVKGEAIKKLQENLQKIGIEGIGKIDGDFGAKTKQAAIDFQKTAGEKQRMQKDGKIIEETNVLTGHKEGIVDKITSDELKKWIQKEWKIPKVKGIFPLPKQYQDKGYHSGARSFGYSRGDRAHAGCDLYAPLMTKVYAVADGVIKDYYFFYWKTFALIVDHGDFSVVYGEVQPPANPEKHGIKVDGTVKKYIAELQGREKSGLPDTLKKGSKVKRGQHIAYVGQLYKSNGSAPFQSTMLHFEKYKNTAKGAFTQRENFSNYQYVQKKPYKRRNDLEDPTKFLDEFELKE